MQMLKARLYEVELQKREAEKMAQEAAETDIGWGHQIRPYVLQPYLRGARMDSSTGASEVARLVMFIVWCFFTDPYTDRSGKHGKTDG